MVLRLMEKSGDFERALWATPPFSSARFWKICVESKSNGPNGLNRRAVCARDALFTDRPVLDDRGDDDDAPEVDARGDDVAEPAAEVIAHFVARWQRIQGVSEVIYHPF